MPASTRKLNSSSWGTGGPEFKSRRSDQQTLACDLVPSATCERNMCHVASPPDLSLVLACYNEERILESSVDEILQVLDTLNLTSEVIFVDDASQDQTSGIIDRILQSNP